MLSKEFIVKACSLLEKRLLKESLVSLIKLVYPQTSRVKYILPIISHENQ